MTRKADEVEELLTVADVARICKLAVGAVYVAIRSGRLKAAQLGSKKALRIEPKELQKWIQNTNNNQNENETIVI